MTDSTPATAACATWYAEGREPQESCPCGHYAASHSFDGCLRCSPTTAAHWSDGKGNRHCAPLAVITEVTIFAGDPDSEDTYAVEVTWRGHDKYAVKRRSQVWNGAEWEYEPQPSSRDDAFISRTRFGYEQAMNLAAGLVAKEVARV